MLSLLKWEKQKGRLYRVKCYTDNEARSKVKVEERENNLI